MGDPTTTDDGKDKEDQKFRLTDMVVESVDLVDRAANKRRFLLVKREAEMGDPNAEMIVTEGRDGTVNASAADGTDTTPADGDKGGESRDDVTKAEDEMDLVCPSCGHTMTSTKEEMDKGVKCEKCGEMMKAKSVKDEDTAADGKDKGEGEENSTDAEGTEKQGISKPVQEKVMSAVREATERLMSVVTVLRGATVTDEKVDAPLPNPLFQELKGIRTILMGLLSAYPAPAPKADDDKGAKDGDDNKDVRKGENIHSALLSEKFEAMGNIVKALSEGIGTMDPKDMQAALRQLNEIAWRVDEDAAVANAVSKRDGGEDGGAVEDPIRILLKQAQNLTIPAPVRDSVAAGVQASLNKLMSLLEKVKDMEASDDASDATIPGPVATALKTCATELGDLIEKYPSPSSKSDAVLARLQAHFDGIKDIVGTMLKSDPATSAKEMTKDGEGTEAGKDDAGSDDNKGGDEAGSADLAKRVDDLTTLVDTQKAEIQRLGGSVGDSNAADTEGEGGGTDVSKSAKVTWASDMGAQADPES